MLKFQDKQSVGHVNLSFKEAISIELFPGNWSHKGVRMFYLGESNQTSIPCKCRVNVNVCLCVCVFVCVCVLCLCLRVCVCLWGEGVGDLFKAIRTMISTEK